MKSNIPPYGEVTLGGLLMALALVIILMFLFSCERGKSIQKSKDTDLVYEHFNIDGCEYIWIKERGAYGQAFVHKGNCKNH